MAQQSPGPTPEPRTEPGAGDDLRAAAQRQGSFFQTLKAVAWSFAGIRKGSGYEQDARQLNPVHVIIAGVLAAAIFVSVLALLVNWIASSTAGPH
jgi:hypothetical protein